MSLAQENTTRISLRLRPQLPVVLSGIALTLVFAPWNLSFLVWIALIPWLMALKKCDSFRNTFIQGLWLGIFMSIGAFSWVASVLHQYAGLPWVVSIAGLLVFSIGGQPQFALSSILIKKAQAHLSPTMRAGIVALICIGLSGFYAGLDWILPKLFVDTLGHAFAHSPALLQLADIGGAHLLTFLIFLSNFSIWLLIEKLRSRTEPSAWPTLYEVGPVLALLIGSILGGIYYGQNRLIQVREHTSRADRHVQVAAIQANIGDFDKIASERGVRGAAKKVLDTFFQLSDEALKLTPKPDFLIWPETSYPSTFRTPMSSDEFARDQQVETFVRTRGVPLLFGGYDQAHGKDYNAFFYLMPDGKVDIYRKSILLMFGEYIPGADSFPWIKQTFPMVGNFGRGPGPSVLEVANVKTGPLICYEVLFPNFVIDAVKKGSRLIVNVTNDSWFGPYGEPELHLALSLFRSVETRIPQIRSTNTGISALILPDGSLKQTTRIFTPEILNVSIPIVEPMPTLMMKWGDWFGPTALSFGVLILVFFEFYFKRKKLT